MTKPKQASAPGPWLTRSEAAAYARVATSTIGKWADMGKLKAFKVISSGSTRGVTRYKAWQIDELLEGASK